VTPNLVDGFSEHRKRLRADLEAQDVPARFGVGRRVRRRAALLPCDERLELMHRLAASDGQPRFFGVGHGATRVSSRTADQLSSPRSSAAAVAGSSSSALATRSFSCVERAPYPNRRSTYSAKVA